MTENNQIEKAPIAQSPAQGGNSATKPKKIKQPKPVAPEAFVSMDLSDEILQAIVNMGFTAPSKVQETAIPILMEGNDLIGIAPTGTGKTCAFGIPMLEYLNLRDKRVQEVVLAPTRELAIQIADEIRKLAYFIKQVKVAVLFGGQTITRQIDQLKKCPQIVVATPGRMLDHIQRGTIKLDAVHTFVLDEADEMLKMGFVNDVCKIIERTPTSRQFIMFSATTNQDVMTISWKYQHEPVQITVEATKENRPQISQYIIPVTTDNKMDQLMYLLDADAYKRIMVFTNTKDMARRLHERLKKAGYDSDALHGDIPQGKRNQIMQAFKKGRFSILVCTDVAARGIDVDDVDAVINFDRPQDNESYLHRIGRTGRARKQGVSFSFCTFTQSVRMDEIMRYMHHKPKTLKMDDMGILRNEKNAPFFDDM